MDENNANADEVVVNDDIINGLKTAIELTKNYMEDQEKSMILLRDIAKTFLTTGSVLLSIIGGLSFIFGERLTIAQINYTIVFGLLFLVYGGFVVFCILAIKHENWHLPLEQDFSLLTRNLCVPEYDRLRMLLSAFLKTLKSNKKIVVRRTMYVTLAALFLGISVLLILVITFLQKLPE